MIFSVAYGVQLYNQYLDSKDKERFMILKEDFDGLHKQLLETKGVNKNWVLEERCDRAGVVYQEATFTCSAFIRIATKIDSNQEAASLVNQINSVLGKNQNIIRPETSKILSSNIPLLSNDLSHDGAQVSYTDVRTGMQCVNSYDITQDKDKRFDFNIQFGCDDHARQLFFPE